MKRSIQRCPIEQGNIARHELPSLLFFSRETKLSGRQAITILSCARLKTRTKVSMKLIFRTHAAE